MAHARGRNLCALVRIQASPHHKQEIEMTEERKKSVWQEMMDRVKSGPFSILSDRAQDEIRWMVDTAMHDGFERGKQAGRTNDLTFKQLQHANFKRLPQFKNAKGEPAHSEPDGSDWALSAWGNAVAGEVGEACNIIKKIERKDMTLSEAREALGNELADAVTYLSILAFRAGIDLGEAVRSKFNEVSDRVGADVKL